MRFGFFGIVSYASFHIQPFFSHHTSHGRLVKQATVSQQVIEIGEHRNRSSEKVTSPAANAQQNTNTATVPGFPRMSDSGRLERGSDETVERINPVDLERNVARNGEAYFSDKAILTEEGSSSYYPEPKITKEMQDILKLLPDSDDFLCTLPTDKNVYKVGILKKPKPADGHVPEDWDPNFADYKEYPRLPDPRNDREWPARAYWIRSIKYDPKKPLMYNPPTLFNTRLIKAHEEHAMAKWRGELDPDDVEYSESDDEDTLLHCSLEQLAVERANAVLGSVSLEEREARAKYHADPATFSVDTFVPRPQKSVQGPNPVVGIFDVAEGHMEFEKQRQEEIKWGKKHNHSRKSLDATLFNRTGRTSQELDKKARIAARQLEAEGKVAPPPLPKGIAKPARKSRKALQNVSKIVRHLSTDPAKRDAQIDTLVATAADSGEESAAVETPEPEVVPSHIAVQPWVQQSPTPRASYGRARSARQKGARAL